MIYETSPLKRKRRTNQELQELLDAIQGILGGRTDRISIRHLFYLLVSAGHIEKTEDAYKNLCAHLSKWRKSGEISFGSFVDSTRWWMREEQHDSIEQALANTVENYRKNLWAQQKHYVELWCEKDAIASTLFDVAADFGVGVFALRGFASLSSLDTAAHAFIKNRRLGKTSTVYYFGDFDPSGIAIDRKAEETLNDELHADVELVRVAVTPKQITEWELPTRPTKKSDSRSKTFGEISVEVDAISPENLRAMALECITKHLPQDEFEKLKRAEALERESLRAFIGKWEESA